MKHWFIDWLHKLELNSTESVDKERFKKWVEISEELINSGVESSLFEYYDAKQSMYPHLLPPRPNRKAHFILDDIAFELEEMIKITTDEDHLELLNNIYTTICELFATGMEDIAVYYYLRKKQGNPELDLPELSSEN